jgi:hypothetical protein
VRSISSKEGDHLRGQYLFHTGYPLVEGFARPSLGAMVSKEAPAAAIPNYVALGAAGFGPAYLGAAHAPFSVDDLRQALDSLRTVGRKKDRIRFARQLDQEFDAGHPADVLAGREEMLRKIEELSDTAFVRALDLEREPARDRSATGRLPSASAVSRRGGCSRPACASWRSTRPAGTPTWTTSTSWVLSAA